MHNIFLYFDLLNYVVISTLQLTLMDLNQLKNTRDFYMKKVEDVNKDRAVLYKTQRFSRLKWGLFHASVVLGICILFSFIF